MNNNLATIHSIQTNTAYESICEFMESKKKDSISTYKSYLKHYNDFFGYLHDINIINGKDLWSVDWNDILNIEACHVKKFQTYITDKKQLSNKTCNQKLFAVKKLWDTLSIDNKNIDRRVLEFIELNEEDNSYAILTSKEVNLLIDFAKTRSKGDIQAMVFEFLYIIGCRKNTPLTLTINQFERRYDYEKEEEAWVVVYDEKGKKGVAKAISDEFYEKIMSFKIDGKEKIFNVSHVLIEDTFDAFRKKYNLEYKNGKRVTLHSIKKASGLAVYKVTGGDLNLTKEHCQHDDVKLTSKTYLDTKDNYCSQGSYTLSKNIDINSLKELSKEDLLNILESCGKDTINRIHYEAEKMGYIK